MGAGVRSFDMGLFAVGGINFFHGGNEVADVVDQPACHTKGIVKHPKIPVYHNQVA